MRFKDIDFIVHLAAETDHEYCDINAPQSYFINSIGAGNMMRLAQSLDIPIIFLSAASIFDGLKESPYTIWDKPNPINHYNASKWYGEIITAAYPRHYIMRAGWMFGGGPSIDKKFVNKIMSKIKAGEKSIRVCDDCIGSPTSSKSLAEFIKSVIENHGTDLEYSYGIYNCANASSGGVSRYEFAKAIVNILGIGIKIVPVKIDDLKEEFPCKRTNYEVLEDNGFMMHWKNALKEYLDAYYRD